MTEFETKLLKKLEAIDTSIVIFGIMIAFSIGMLGLIIDLGLNK